MNIEHLLISSHLLEYYYLVILGELWKFLENYGNDFSAKDSLKDCLSWRSGGRHVSILCNAFPFPFQQMEEKPRKNM